MIEGVDVLYKGVRGWGHKINERKSYKLKVYSVGIYSLRVCDGFSRL